MALLCYRSSRKRIFSSWQLRILHSIVCTRAMPFFFKRNINSFVLRTLSCQLYKYWRIKYNVLRNVVLRSLYVSCYTECVMQSRRGLVPILLKMKRNRFKRKLSSIIMSIFLLNNFFRSTAMRQNNKLNQLVSARKTYSCISKKVCKCLR